MCPPYTGKSLITSCAPVLNSVSRQLSWLYRTSGAALAAWLGSMMADLILVVVLPAMVRASLVALVGNVPENLIWVEVFCALVRVGMLLGSSLLSSAVC